MKRIYLTIIGLVFLSSLSLNAQKIGYCELESIITIMPEYQLAQAKLEGEVRDIESQAEEMQVEFNNKYQAYTDNAALATGATGKWSSAIQAVKEQELADLQQRISDFQSTAQQTLQMRQFELLEPITAKLDSVIDVIMVAEGITFVVKDLSVMQVNKAKCIDVGPMIKQRLGLQ
ncbi:MAG: OmpH family outer membrane protein [Bacteroidales bacterium]|nr:OmpH family outer membrane protein [Bacteroidales bacterium]